MRQRIYRLVLYTIFFGSLVYSLLHWLGMDPKSLEADTMAVNNAKLTSRIAGGVTMGLVLGFWSIALPFFGLFTSFRCLIVPAAVFLLGVYIGSAIGSIVSGYLVSLALTVYGTAIVNLAFNYRWSVRLTRRNREGDVM